MTSLDDQHYISLVLKGDKQAFAVLAARYKDMLFTLLLGMVKKREEAEDLLQEIFIKVYRSLAGFKGDARFSTWLYKVAYNSCLDYLKKNKMIEKALPLEEIEETTLGDINDTLDGLERKERTVFIRNCLAMLAVEENLILTLYYLEEQPLKEIAIVMGITANNAKIKLHRSRQKLMAILNKKLQPEILS